MARTASLSEVEDDVDKRRLRLWPLALEGRPPGLVVVVVEEQQRMTRLEEGLRLRVVVVVVVVRMRCFNGCEDRLHSLTASISSLVCFPSTARCLVPISLHFTSNGPWTLAHFCSLSLSFSLLCEFNESNNNIG